MVEDGREIRFPALDAATGIFGLDAVTLAESALCKLDAGYGSAEATRMTIVEELQKHGAYHGRLKQLVDDGTIFQMRAADDAESVDRKLPLPSGLEQDKEPK